jgi:hypothetical protein
MIWFFERRGERLHCEIRTAPDGGLCELVWTASDGRTYAEQSYDSSELVRRRRALEQWLKMDGWVRLGRLTPPRLMRPPIPAEPRQRLSRAGAPNVEFPQRIVVCRGQVETYELLRRTFFHDSGVQVIWDRRVADRRRSLSPTDTNRRKGERRREPPPRWTDLHYLVVPVAECAAP